jgi:hypothetical protein
MMMLFTRSLDEPSLGRAHRCGLTVNLVPSGTGLDLLSGHGFQQPETHLPWPSNSMVRSLIAR